MKRRIVSLVLALTLATALLLGGLTAPREAAAAYSATSASISGCGYAGSYCYVNITPTGGCNSWITLTFYTWPGYSKVQTQQYYGIPGRTFSARIYVSPYERADQVVAEFDGCGGYISGVYVYW
jgi:hypothetical protein